MARILTVLSRGGSLPPEPPPLLTLGVTGNGWDAVDVTAGQLYTYPTASSTQAGIGAPRYRVFGPYYLNEDMDVTTFTMLVSSVGSGATLIRPTICNATEGSSTVGSHVWTGAEQSIGSTDATVVSWNVTGLTLTAGWYWLGYWTNTPSGTEPQWRYRNTSEITYLQKWQVSYSSPAYASTGDPGTLGTPTTSASREFPIYVSGTPTALTAPSSLSVASSAAREVALTWTAGDTRARLQRIEMTTDGGTWETRAFVGSGATAWTDTGFVPNVRYRFRVVSLVRSTESAASGTGTVVVSSASRNLTAHTPAVLGTGTTVYPSVGVLGQSSSNPVLGAAMGTPLIRYQRIEWSDVQPAYGGTYNWSVVDALIGSAAAWGQRAAFRVRDVVPNRTDTCPTSTPGTSVSGVTFVPDWGSVRGSINHRNQAMATRYNGNGTVAWIEFGEDGAYGEVRNYGGIGTLYRAPDGTLADLLGTFVAAFTTTPVVFSFGGEGGFLGSLVAAYPTMGISADSYGHATQDTATAIQYWSVGERARADFYDYRTGRARAGYCVGEWFDPGSIIEGSSPVVLDTERLRLRPSIWRDANCGSVPLWAASTQTVVYQTIRGIGARLSVTGVIAPTSITTGDTVRIVSAWQNTGNARVREAATMRWTVRDTSGGLIFTTNGSLDLRSVPEDGFAPWCVSDSVTFNTPGGTPGTHLLCVEFSNNAALANVGSVALAGGSVSYPVGTIVVTG